MVGSFRVKFLPYGPNMNAPKRFKLTACTVKPKSPIDEIPKANEVKTCSHSVKVAPPRSLLDQLENNTFIIGIDVETHGWPQNQCRKGHIGRFGWYTLKDETSLTFARIVQLGWVIGNLEPDNESVTKNFLIIPNGFEISAQATQFHKISHERALREGRPLSDVLCELMNDVLHFYRHGARVVAHQLEFDATVIFEELGRCGLLDLQKDWEGIARKGYCTMNPTLGRWLKQRRGEEVGPTSVQHALGLQNTLGRLLPEVIPPHHHVAVNDARMARQIYVALLKEANLCGNDATDGITRGVATTF